jgi:hypothetical protein
MEAKYFISLRSLLRGISYLHREDCPFLPDEEHRACLGSFTSAVIAAKEARIHFRNTGCCAFCAKEGISDSPGGYSVIKNMKINSAGTVKVSENQESAMVAGLN